MATTAASKKTTTKKTGAKTTTSKTKTAKTKSTKTSGRGSARKTASAQISSGLFLKRIKGAGWLAILESIVVGVLGVLLITSGDTIVKIIFYVLGIFLMIKGVYKIINYFAVHGKYDFYNNDLLYGIIALVFGIISVVLWEQLGSMIGIIVGAWMIYGALVRMNTAIKLRTAGVKEWFYVLILSMVMLALGIYMVISVKAIFIVVGWVMIAAAVIGILDDMIFIKHLNQIS